MQTSVFSSKPKPGAKPEVSFVIRATNDDDLICGELKTKADAQRVKEAIETMLNVATKWPRRLASESVTVASNAFV